MNRRNYIGVLMLMSSGFLVTLLVFSCKKNEPDLLTNTCATATKSVISYSKDVYPIIQQNCLSCHDAKNHSGGIVIENFVQISESAKIGELMNSIAPASGYPSMPKGSKLTDCQIAAIQNWINQGINNN